MRVFVSVNVHVRCTTACHAVESKTEGGRVFRSAPELCCAGQSSDPCERRPLKGKRGRAPVTDKHSPFLLSHGEIMKAVHTCVCVCVFMHTVDEALNHC